MRAITEWQNVDLERFQNEIVPRSEPAVIRSLAVDWPAVRHGVASPAAICRYLMNFDNGTPAYTIVGEPGINGRFFYRDDLQDVNYRNAQIKLSSVLEKLLEMLHQPSPHAIAIQAVRIPETLPGFAEENRLPLLDSVAPTMWLGNQGMVAPHYDIYDNVACVVAGERKFTLFPPDQINNLYVGPILVAPGGVPISMVDIRSPDLARFPRFSHALEVAQQAVLQAGDALYIPGLWWHGVESLQNFNVLVNYWWGGMSDSQISPNDSLWHSMLAIAKLSPAQRAAWRSYFDYYVFRTDCDPAAHLPPELNDIVTSLSPEQKKYVLDLLTRHLE